jgi:hypothetical protein
MNTPLGGSAHSANIAENDKLLAAVLGACSHRISTVMAVCQKIRSKPVLKNAQIGTEYPNHGTYSIEYCLIEQRGSSIKHYHALPQMCQTPGWMHDMKIKGPPDLCVRGFLHTSSRSHALPRPNNDVDVVLAGVGSGQPYDWLPTSAPPLSPNRKSADMLDHSRPVHLNGSTYDDTPKCGPLRLQLATFSLRPSTSR